MGATAASHFQPLGPRLRRRFDLRGRRSEVHGRRQDRAGAVLAGLIIVHNEMIDGLDPTMEISGLADRTKSDPRLTDLHPRVMDMFELAKRTRDQKQASDAGPISSNRIPQAAI